MCRPLSLHLETCYTLDWIYFKYELNGASFEAIMFVCLSVCLCERAHVPRYVYLFSDVPLFVHPPHQQFPEFSRGGGMHRIYYKSIIIIRWAVTIPNMTSSYLEYDNSEGKLFWNTTDYILQFIQNSIFFIRIYNLRNVIPVPFIGQHRPNDENKTLRKKLTRSVLNSSLSTKKREAF